MYCPQREINAKKRQQGLKVKFCDPVIRKAWESSSNADEFNEQLQQSDYMLAKGRRLVVVDSSGNIINPARALGITVKEFKEKLGDVSNIQALNNTSEDTLKAQAQFIRNKRKDMEASLGVSEILGKILKLEFKIAHAGILQRLTGIHSFRIRKLESLRQQLVSINRHIDEALQTLKNDPSSVKAPPSSEKTSEP